jgi:cytochrome c-type biogenesis protein CcmH/NrfF
MAQPTWAQLQKKVSMLIASGMTNAQIKQRMIQDYGPGSITMSKPIDADTLQDIFDPELLQLIRKRHRISGKASKYDRS